MGDLTEDQDQFFDTREEITSLSDSSSDVGEKSDLDGIFGSNELFSSFGYDVWIRSPGTISERRQRLLKLMGLSAVPDQTEKEDPASKLECSGVEIDISRITEDYGAVLRSSSCNTQISGQDLESCCSTESSELFGEVLDDSLLYRIRNLDNGREFIVDELGQDGLLKRLREVGSNRVVTGQEFERILGMSPLVQQIMRKDAMLSPRRSMVRKRSKKGWLRWLGLTSAESAIADGWSSSQIRTQIVKVRAVRKHSKQLSALCVSQDISAHDGAILTMKFSPDGKLLASAGEDGVVRVWQVTETQRSSSNPITDTSSSNIYFMTNDLGELVPLNVDKRKGRKMRGLGKSSESACVILPKSGFCIAEEPLHVFHGHRAQVLDLSWSKDKCLLSSSVDKTVRLWRVGVDTCQQVFSHNDYVTCVQFNPVDENHFISGSIDGKVRIWAVNGCEVVDWTNVKGIVTALSYQPDGKGAVVGSMGGDCFFFDTSDNQLQLIDQMCLQGKKKSPSRRITGLQFSPVDPSKLMVTSADSHVRIFQGGNIICKYRALYYSGFRNGGSQICASFSEDGTHIVSASEDSNVYMWEHGIFAWNYTLFDRIYKELSFISLFVQNYPDFTNFYQKPPICLIC
ncbi:WD repeat-containing protein 44-like [Phyllobates terribilis]|uniref:WD repeat-containing protein 44-like n=1 Tax=Phyllobates terribilis TaxID=111132 RepID=UPI003CCA8EDB